MIDLVFYGEKPTVNNFRPIKNNQGWSKPQGGLWTSPMMENNISAWQAYCEKVGMGYSKQRWHIVLEPKCKILVVEENLSNIFPYLVKSNLAHLRYVIDFERLRKDFDMIYVPEEVVKDERYRHTVFNGYDVPTGLFLNMVDKNNQPLFKALNDKEFEEFKSKYKQPAEKTPQPKPQYLNNLKQR